MADVLTKEQRHKNMKNIRGKDTKIEVILRKALWNRGYRYRKNYRKLPKKWVLSWTMNKEYWSHEERKRAVANIDASKGYGRSEAEKK